MGFDKFSTEALFNKSFRVHLTLNNTVLEYITPYSLVEIHRRFRGPSCSPIPGNHTTIFLTDTAKNILRLKLLPLVRNDKIQLTLRHMKLKYFIIN